jgi:Arc/MetJ family transcription regulator
MDLEFLQAEWDKDSKIDLDDLVTESLKITQLHGKYYKYLSTSRLAYERELEKRKALKTDLTDYYCGKAGQELLASLGNRVQYQKEFVVKDQLKDQVESDKLMRDFNLRLVYHKEKIEFLQDIIKCLHQRSFNIKNAIEWYKFKNGIG